MTYDPNKETNAERIARKKQERKDHVARQEREAFERENQPRDAEEERNAKAEDKHLAENLAAILRAAEGMSAEEFETKLRKTPTRKIKAAGGKAHVRKEFKKKGKGGCAVVALALVGAAGLIGWGGVELIFAVVA